MHSRPIQNRTGSVFENLDLSSPMDHSVIAAIRAALVDRCVVVIPRQSLTPAHQVAFAKHFGHVPKVPDSMFRVHDDDASVSVLENDVDRPPTVNNWHSDYSFAAEPDLASVLYAVAVPDQGGDTVWCNQFAAYEALSDRMQTFLDGLTASHDFMKLYERPAKQALWEGARGALMRQAAAAFPPVSHPVVQPHAESGRNALFVNQSFTRHIDGMSESESRWLLGFLFEHMQAPEFHLRHHWQPGDLVMWDNRSTAHYAVADYHPAHRLMHRVTVLAKPRDGKAHES